MVPEATKRQVLQALDGSGVAFEAVGDLCELSARRDPALKRIAQSGTVKIAACYPRAVKWLFAAAGAPLPTEGVDILNMRSQPAEEIIRALLDGAGPNASQEGGDALHEQELRLAADGEWVPWFPVIDYDRCVGCKQCASFCLFGVYAVSEQGNVRVENPAHCKTNCPACARICPEAAIIFPKYPAGPINGDEVRAEDLQQQKMKVDVKELLAGDVYKVLRDRGKGAAAELAGELDRQRALNEREGCSCASQPAENVISLETLLSSPNLADARVEANNAEAHPEHGQDAPGDGAEGEAKEDHGAG